MISHRLYLALIFAIAATSITTSAIAGTLAPAVVEVALDEARIVRLDANAAQIIVGNPAIADVTAQSPRILVVTGKSFGTTNLIALDTSGREIYAARLGVGEGDVRLVRIYRGTLRQSLHCAPDCQRTLAIGDDKSQFEQVADSVVKRFGVVQSAIGGPGGN